MDRGTIPVLPKNTATIATPNGGKLADQQKSRVLRDAVPGFSRSGIACFSVFFALKYCAHALWTSALSMACTCPVLPAGFGKWLYEADVKRLCAVGQVACGMKKVQASGCTSCGINPPIPCGPGCAAFAEGVNIFNLTTSTHAVAY
jgi:hypothetical protein